MPVIKPDCPRLTTTHIRLPHYYSAVFVCAHLQAGGVELVNADAHCTEQQTVRACSLLLQCRWSHGSSSCGVGGAGQVLVPSPDDMRVLLMMEVLMTKVQQQQ
jgi:hypothetical protein